MITAAVARAIEQEAGVFADFLKMSVDGIEPRPLVDGDGGDEDVKPWDGETFSTEPPGEGDGAVPVVLAVRADESTSTMAAQSW